MVEEPGVLYLSHFSPKNGKGHTIAKQIHSIIANTDLKHKLILVCIDGTASMTGNTNGCIAWLEPNIAPKFAVGSMPTPLQ